MSNNDNVTQYDSRQFNFRRTHWRTQKLVKDIQELNWFDTHNITLLNDVSCFH